jgi:hypothetical protein
MLFGDFFAGAGYLLPLVVAAAAGAAVGGVTGRRTPAVLAIGYLAGTATLLAALDGAAMIAGVPGAGAGAVAGVAHAWGRMLSVNLPADPEPALLIFPWLLLWTASWLAAALSARMARPAAPVAPLVAAYALALLLTADRQRDHPWLTTAFLLTLGALALVRTRAVYPVRVSAATAGSRVRGARPAGGAGGPAATVAVAAVATIVAVAAAFLPPRLDAARRFDIRAVDPPPVRVDPGVTPLETLKASLVAPARPLFSVRVTAPSGVRVDRVRVAALDAYDGVIWSSDDRFLVAGRVLAQWRAGTGRAARIDVRLDDWAGPFLPVIGAPTALGGTDVTGPRAGFAAGSGTLVWVGTPRQSMTYSLSALVTPADADLTNARPVQPGQDARLSDPVPPEALRQLSASLLGGQGTPYQRLLRLAAAIRARPYNAAAPSGHSYDRLLTMMTAAAGTVGAAGFSEQHAAAFALLARLAGFDTRVSVGYLLRGGQDGTGTHTVTSKDLYAWPEVSFSGYGWVPFEPTDPRRTAPSADDSPPAPTPDTSPDQPDTGTTGTAGSAGGARPPAIVDAGHRPPPLAGTAAWLGLVLLVLAGIAVIAAGGILVAKRTRRRRRARGTPAERLAGAWLQALDDLAGHAFLAVAGTRFTVTIADTPGSAARLATAAFGPVAAPLADLARRVTALESGGPPPDEAAADQAWADLSALRQALDRPPARRRTGAPGRLDVRARPLVMARAGLDPRPLWRDAALRRAGRRARWRLEGTRR